MKTDLSDVIARLTEAKELDRRLDFEISDLHGKQGTTAQHMEVRRFLEKHHRMPGETTLRWLPWYTMSLDAALTLVPEGLGWSFSTHERSANGAHLAAYVDGAFGFGATPPLCLCIASLRARENKE